MVSQHHVDPMTDTLFTPAVKICIWISYSDNNRSDLSFAFSPGIFNAFSTLRSELFPLQKPAHKKFPTWKKKNSLNAEHSVRLLLMQTKKHFLQLHLHIKSINWWNASWLLFWWCSVSLASLTLSITNAFFWSKTMVILICWHWINFKDAWE